MNKPKLTMIELFSGIGAQKRGIDNTGLYDLQCIGTSDIDKEAVVEYAAIHCGLTNEMVENFKGYPTKECMAQSLTNRKIGLDFKTGKIYDWFKLAKKKKGMDLEKYWLAAELTNNLGDISSIEKLPYCDILTFSSPCTDYSIAGRQEGSFNTCNVCGHKFNPFNYDIEERYNCPNCGSDDVQGTRSGLLKEVERLLVNSIKAGEPPKYLFQENVDALVSKKFKPDFDAFCRRLENLNYSVYWTVLNAKECGVPQNRRRLMMIGIRKDIDTGKFTFPIPFDNGLRLKDVLENNVDEKYYINTERAANLIQQLVDKGQLKGQREESKGVLVKNQATEVTRTVDTANTLMARDWKGFGNQDMVAIVESEKLDSSKRLGGLWDGKTTHQAGSVWDSNGMSPTLDTAQGGGRQPHIIEDTTKPICVGNTTPSGKSQCNAVYSPEGVSQTLCAGTHGYSTGSIVEEQQREQLIVNIGNSSRYRINNFGEVFDNQNGVHKLQEIDGYVELEVGGELRKVFVEKLMNKYFPQFLSEYIESKNIEPKVIGIKQATKKGYIECELPGCADLSFPNSQYRRGRVQGNGQIVPTLTAAEGGIRYIESIYRIRKLTPRECFKLMGFTFEDWDKCSNVGISNSAGYKAAGNSIVTDCIKLLFEHLYKAQYDDTYICTDEKMQNFQKPEVVD